MSAGNCSDSADTRRPVISAVMFTTGVVSNAVALVLLEVRRRRRSKSLYQVLVTVLLTTDLLGSLSVSPVVLAAYAQGKSLREMGANNAVCNYFGFSMTFLSLSTLAILCVMALERYVSVGHPYFHEKHLSKRRGCVAMALIYLGSVLFCAAPFLASREYMQYCPGTWCFLSTRRAGGEGGGDVDNVFIGLYASIILVMIVTTMACNISVSGHLVRMHRRGKLRSVPHRRGLSMSEEVEHLLPLVIITVVFVCCTLPLVIQVYIDLTGRGQDRKDLRALRLLSFHSIINPWVLIILRPSVLKSIWRKLRRPQKSTFTCERTLKTQASKTEGRPHGTTVEAGL